MRQGNRTIRRHRIVAGGSAAMALALVATGASLLTRPQESAAPQPATRTATDTVTPGIVRAQTAHMGASGSAQVEFNRDPRVKLNVKYSLITDDGRRHEVGSSSAGKPGQKAETTWRSAVIDGHPVTIGLIPGSATGFTASGGSSEGSTAQELKGTGYTMFYVTYTPVRVDPKTPTRPPEFASIRWAGPNGIVDGIAGGQRLTGRTLTVGNGVSVNVVLRPDVGGRTTVFGTTYFRDAKAGYGFDLSTANTGPSVVAVVTGRQPIASNVLLKGQKVFSGTDGPPIAAGILPPGATDIGVILTTGEVANGLPVTERLPDGRVIFAIKAESAQPSQPSKDSVKAVTWTNADGSLGRKDVTQKQP